MLVTLVRTTQVKTPCQRASNLTGLRLPLANFYQHWYALRDAVALAAHHLARGAVARARGLAAQLGIAINAPRAPQRARQMLLRRRHHGDALERARRLAQPALSE